MIFACYAGNGKTTAAMMREDTLDLLLAPFKYKLPELAHGTYEEREALKATDHDDFDIWYPKKYTDAIFDNIPKYRHILIPTDESVLKELDRRNIEYLIVIPDFRQDGIKDFYEDRYRKRGNNEQFFRIFVGQWERRMMGLLALSNSYVLLSKEQFVSDIVMQYDEQVRKKHI